MKPAPTVLTFPDQAAVARDAADRFVSLAVAAVRERGRFVVALSGGSTPRELYALLAGDEFKSWVDWARCSFFWGDERAVPPDSPESNFRMANDTLLSHVPVPQQNIHRIRGEEPPEQAAAEYEQELRAFAGGKVLRFDLVLLGLGTNGHTASLFPETTALRERERWCVAARVPELNAYRITLTAPLLNEGLQVVFLVTGADKAPVAAEVLRGPYEPERLPAQLIRPASGTLLWLLDAAAAKDLTTGKH